MNKKRSIQKYKENIKSLKLEDYKNLAGLAFLHSHRQYQSAFIMYQGPFKEHSYNLFYIAIEEMLKCYYFSDLFKNKNDGKSVTNEDLEELGQLFHYHKFKIEKAIKIANDTISKKKYIFQDNKGLDPIGPMFHIHVKAAKRCCNLYDYQLFTEF